MLVIWFFFFIPPQLDTVYHHSGVKVNNKIVLVELIIQRNVRKKTKNPKKFEGPSLSRTFFKSGGESLEGPANICFSINYN